MSEVSTYYVFICGIDVINVIIHGIGIFLLLRTYKGRCKTNQQLLIINLWLCLLLKNLLYGFNDAAAIVNKIYGPHQPVGVYTNSSSNNATSSGPHLITDIQIYSYYALSIPIFYYYILSLFYLTCDRLLATLFITHYIRVWNQQKTKTLILCSALIFVGSWFIVINILSSVYQWDMNMLERKVTAGGSLNLYIPASVSGAFVVFATVSYYLMFTKFVRSRRASTVDTSAINLFRRSRFHVAVLLVLSTSVLNASSEHIVDDISCNVITGIRKSLLHLVSWRFRYCIWYSRWYYICTVPSSCSPGYYKNISKGQNKK